MKKPPPKGRGRRQAITTNKILRYALAFWAIAYPMASCGLAPSDPRGGITPLSFLMTGGLLLMPWLVGLLILGVLTWVTKPQTP